MPRFAGSLTRLGFQALGRLCFLSGLTLCIGSTAAPASAAVQASSSPWQAYFETAKRWSYGPEPSEGAWAPANLAFTENGQYVWTSSGFGAGRLTLLPSAQALLGKAQALLVDDTWTGLKSEPVVDCGRGLSELFALTQHSDPHSNFRITRLHRYDATHVLPSSGTGTGSGAGFGQPAHFTPLWSAELPTLTNAPAGLAWCNGELQVVSYDAQIGASVFTTYSGTGALVRQIVQPGGQLHSFAVSSDAERLAYVADDRLRVLDSNGLVLVDQTLAQPTRGLCISEGGHCVAVGELGRIRTFEEQINGSYAPGPTFNGSANELPVLLKLGGAVSSSGAPASERLAAAWWNAVSNDLRLELWDLPSNQRLFEKQQLSQPQALQNFPTGLCMDRAAERVAWSVWGQADDRAEVQLFDANGNALIEVDGPGSALALALDPSGTRLCFGMKSVHANQFSDSGSFELWDTGERDLQLLQQPNVGQPLRAIAQGAPGSDPAQTVVFLFGNPLPIGPSGMGRSGVQIGTLGTIYLNRRLGLRALPVPADSAGMGELYLPIPANPGLVGTQVGLQALFRAPGWAKLSLQFESLEFLALP